MAAAASAPVTRVAAAGVVASAKPSAPSASSPEAAPAAAAPASSASAPTLASAARPDPVAPKPFDEVIKGATEQAGYFGLWRKDEKLWLEIAPERHDEAFLLSVNISHSVGERRLYGSMMGPSWLASFRRIGSQQIQLIALNTNYVASGAPMKAAIDQAFSHSLVASAAIASAPHPQRKSVLIDAAFLLADIAGYSTQLERAYRLPYGLDRGNSFFEKTRVTDDLTTLSARLHFATARRCVGSFGVTSTIRARPRGSMCVRLRFDMNRSYGRDPGLPGNQLSIGVLSRRSGSSTASVG